MKRDINSSAFLSLDEATFRVFREQIETRFGEKITRCCQVKKLREAVFNKTHQYISESSYKRFFGLVKYEGGRFSKSTLDILALYIGYESFSELQAEISDRSLVAPLQTLIKSHLEKGSQIRISFAKGLETLMCYLGENTFIINCSTMPLLAKGEIFSAARILAGTCLEGAENKLKGDITTSSTLVTTIRIVV